MKYIFLGIFILLLIASGVMVWTAPEQQSGRPIIYWVTDANPARIEQIRLFHEWMARTGRVDGRGQSAVELRLDTANGDPSKKIIQSVSGVAGDVMDLYHGGELRLMQSMGVLHDVSDRAHTLGFDPTQTYAAALDEIVIDDHQYGFPCNVTAPGYWVNKDAFAHAGVTPPPWRWTLDDFERIGKEFVEKANAGQPRRDIFFCTAPDYLVMCRSLGLDRFNETLTRCTLDDPRFVRLLQRIDKWTFQDRIIPTSDDLEALSTQQAGYGGNQFQLFNRGKLAMVFSGRYALIQFRQFNASRRSRGQAPMDLLVVEPPNGGFPNTGIAARSAAVFFGSHHADLGPLFLSFLASEDYNMQIVEDADSLPPNPAYARSQAFARPPKYPEEIGLHEPWAVLAETIAIPASYSPFIPERVAMRIIDEKVSLFFSHQVDAERAAQRTAHEIHAEIERRLHEDPELRVQYERRLADQKRIDELRTRREVVPLSLIINPFHRRYFAEKGWAK